MTCEACRGAGRMGRLTGSWFVIAPDVDLDTLLRVDERLIVEPCLVCGGDGVSSDEAKVGWWFPKEDV